MPDVKEAADNALEQADHDRLNRVISVIVAVSATFLSLCNVKDGNIVQAMQKAQAEQVDFWGYYQARSTKQHVAEGVAAQLTATEATLAIDSPARAELERVASFWKGEAVRYGENKKETEDKAKAAATLYDTLNLRDDQFDMAEASLSMAIALLGITALTRQKWLMWMGAVFAAFGLFMGVCGFTGLPFHPDTLASWLS